MDKPMILNRRNMRERFPIAFDAITSEMKPIKEFELDVPSCTLMCDHDGTVYVWDPVGSEWDSL